MKFFSFVFYVVCVLLLLLMYVKQWDGRDISMHRLLMSKRCMIFIKHNWERGHNSSFIIGRLFYLTLSSLYDLVFVCFFFKFKLFTDYNHLVVFSGVMSYIVIIHQWCCLCSRKFHQSSAACNVFHLHILHTWQYSQVSLVFLKYNLFHLRGKMELVEGRENCLSGTSVHFSLTLWTQILAGRWDR